MGYLCVCRENIKISERFGGRKEESKTPNMHTFTSQHLTAGCGTHKGGSKSASPKTLKLETKIKPQINKTPKTKHPPPKPIKQQQQQKVEDIFLEYKQLSTSNVVIFKTEELWRGELI